MCSFPGVKLPYTTLVQIHNLSCGVMNMIDRYRKTPVAARELQVSYGQLMNLLRFNKMRPPERDSSGDYVWSESDLARARAALATVRKRRQAVAETAG